MLNRLDRLRHRFAALYQKSREKKIELFTQLTGLQAGERIIDVGVDEVENNPFENLLEKQLSDSHRIVAVTLGDPSLIKDRYPHVCFVRADGCALPFRDSAFDILFSNAVIEHVGNEAAQRTFVEEATRVAKMGVITTPNYWFPIELHSSLPFVHYLPWCIRRHVFRMLAGKEHERYMSSIRLLSARAFKRLFRNNGTVRIRKVHVTFWPETLLAFFERDEGTPGQTASL